MANIYRILSLLLSYPSAELQAARGEIETALADASPIRSVDKKRVAALIEAVCDIDLYDAQERYVVLFDRSRSLSLHLFEHVHGESRDRGQAMVDLAAHYEAAGFNITARELPDYLPLFLEFLSTREPGEAAELLDQTGPILAVLRQRLDKRGSVYAGAFWVLETLMKSPVDAAAVQPLLDQEEDDPTDLAGLDKIWEEEAVTFMGNRGDASCGPDRLRTALRAQQRSVHGCPEAGER
ncbi:MAG: nitrate reductase molybdenum cofactor assembly chaperone [Pelagibacterium sp. SCN 63-23]|nr:MAG: nitrate reductase molybdenum cofactor assembly chaperone [Pelagibacterium sp. SCN 63-23]